jgi:L-serine dehydratase
MAMYQYQYKNQKEIEQLTGRHHISISELAMRHEAERSEVEVSEVKALMKRSLDVMKLNIQTGVASKQPSVGGLIGQNAAKVYRYSQSGNALGGELLMKATAYALAVTEENARMKRIVACPTAGACGVVPGCLVAVGEQRALSDDILMDGLFNASAVGIVIASGATISGAEGGCQAEIGAASAMAASALTEIGGGSVLACINAAALAIKNILGLVCDPVAGLVEVPCSKRNAMGVANAIVAADMALAGVTSVIPLDEVVKAMRDVGRALPFELKETARGGVAASQTGIEIKKRMRNRADETSDDGDNQLIQVEEDDE